MFVWPCILNMKWFVRPTWLHLTTCARKRFILNSRWRRQGTRWRSCMRHCATSRKVKGSIYDGVIWIFHWLHPQGWQPYHLDGPYFLKSLEPQFPAALRVCPGLYRDIFTFLYIGVGGTNVSGKIDAFMWNDFVRARAKILVHSDGKHNLIIFCVCRWRNLFAAQLHVATLVIF